MANAKSYVPLPAEAPALVRLELAGSHPGASMSHKLGRGIIKASRAVEPPRSLRQLYGVVEPVQLLGVRCLDGLSRGMPLKAIARRTGLPSSEVQQQIDGVADSINARTEKEAIRIAVELGLLPSLDVSSRDVRPLTPAQAILLGMQSRGWSTTEVGLVFGMGAPTLDQYASEAYQALDADPYGSIRVGLAVGALAPDWELLHFDRPEKPDIV